MSGSTVLEAVQASYIKPWKWSTKPGWQDPENGLRLIATIDALFDAGLVTFSANARLIPSSVLTEADQTMLVAKDPPGDHNLIQFLGSTSLLGDRAGLSRWDQKDDLWINASSSPYAAAFGLLTAH